MSETATRPLRKGSRSKSAATSGVTAPPAPRLPAVQRQRRLGLAALATLLIVGFGALAGALVLRSGDRTDVVSVVADVPAGQRITAADLGLASVAVDGIATVPGGERAAFIGQVARVGLVAGTLLTPAAVTSENIPVAGQAVVGMSLVAGRLPAGGLEPGDVVLVVRAGDAAQPQGDAGVPGVGSPVLVERARVYSSETDTVNGGSLVSLIVAATEAPKLTVASSQQQVALALLSREPAS